MSSVVVRSADREAVARAVAAYVTRLRAEHAEILDVIWFGSWVNGIPLPGSDVDLCLIVAQSDKPIRERVSEYLPAGFPVGIDLFVYTQAEFDELKHSAPGWHQAIIAGRAI